VKCIDVKRRGAEHVRKKLAGMPREEEPAYWAERTEDLRGRYAIFREERES